ncbi:unnamed protein product (macronuclear) [Paramecium tetraurelia]|uniref:Uncharacterized protein n=1 Tax=Paramecium tetraurelia TaxID=5888 RepID=A0E3K7_PARTE|nr:uncharacterized protein GSPATT00023047001 [Paramecium tetraurelia]CAK89874.1 unnamed protein product [Paramecium tetraurelia]|eukprot:XP_001457271.1 hypothetical protein (macronuclear) [Paramecium tetraurelia strain d4-2]
MISEDLEIDLLTQSHIESDNDRLENNKPAISQHRIRVSTQIKSVRPPKSKKKAPSSQTQNTDEKKSHESPDIIMIGYSKAKLAKANTIMRKIKKKIKSKQNNKQAPKRIKKVQKPLRTNQNKAQSKFQSVVLCFKAFLKGLKENMQRALDEGGKILKEIE